ncbi:MAG: recombinase family protein [Deltaproteobacteria bacterium]|nr:recombinase family protein [Deltaproteobacteria bacterium]
MSTEHQKFSTENQGDIIKEYADSHGMVIVKTYADDGKSGLSIDGRDALKRLIDDVETGKANFNVILVYDISRWGRFQDADESAYYEYICKRVGINVIYCAEQFTNDGSPVSTIVKGVKRAMAGEYSRELSVKVFKGQCKLIEQGYRQGGPAGYGLRRMLIDQHGNRKGLLLQGEHKSLQTDRVILVPGPQEEIDTARSIYKMFVHEGKSELDIASWLNARGVRTDLGRYWTRGTVHQVLINEKYIGNNIFNKSSFKLKKKRVKNPPDMWIRADGAFDAIVDSQIFYQAQGIILERNRRYSNEEMLDRLKYLFQKHGKLSGMLIDETEGMPSSAVYRTRFHGLVRAYRLVGYTPDRDYQYIRINRFLRKYHKRIIDEVINQIKDLGGMVVRDDKTDLLLINNEFTTSIVVARCWQTPAGSLRWLIRLDTGLAPDITVALRMDTANQTPIDYYLLPIIDIEMGRFRLAEDNGANIDTYRFENLEFFFCMAEHVKIWMAA